MTDAGTGSAGDVGPRRIWLVAVLFGLVSSVVLGGIVVLATRSPGSSSGTSSDAGVGGDTVPVPPADGGTGLPTVALIGDSITEQSELVFTAQLEDRWELLVDGRSGYTITEQLPAARALAASQPTQVVINLGSNDVAHVTSTGAVRAEVAEMVGLFPDARCIHLVTVNTGIVWAGRSYAEGAEVINEAMASLAAEDPRVQILDWSAAVAAAEADGLPDGAVLTDDVHPTAAGRQLLAELYDDALSSCPST